MNLSANESKERLHLHLKTRNFFTGVIDKYRCHTGFCRLLRFFSGTASSFICEISSLVTAANREAILLITYASLNSTG